MSMLGITMLSSRPELTEVTRIRMLAFSVSAAVAVFVMTSAPIPLGIVVLGLLVGVVYGVLAVGLSLIYRASGVLNLALGVTGALGSEVMQVAISYGAPWAVAVVCGLLASAIIGAATGAVLDLRLRQAPRVLAIMTTVGIAVMLVGLGNELGKLRDTRFIASDFSSGEFELPWTPKLSVGNYVVQPRVVLLLIVFPVVVAAVAAVLRMTLFGVALRASADDGELARTEGIPARLLITIAWASASALAALVSILGPFDQTRLFDLARVAGRLGALPAADGSFRLLLWSVAAALVARFKDVPTMILIGIVGALFEQAIIWNDIDRFAVQAFLGIMLLGAAFTGDRESRNEPVGAWMSVALNRSWPEPLASSPVVLRLRRVIWVLAIAGLLILGAAASELQARDYATLIGLSMIGLSVFVESGLGGRLTLAQVPIGALGAVMSVTLLARTGTLPIAYLGAALAGVLVGAVLGRSSTPSRAIQITGITLLMAVVTEAVLVRVWPSERPPGLPIIDGQPVSLRVMMAIAAVVVGISIVMVTRLRPGMIGLQAIAARDNRPTARSFGIRVQRNDAVVGAFSGVLAALGGAMALQSSRTTESGLFILSSSLMVVFAVALGGLSSHFGAIFGVLVIFGAQVFAPEAGIASLGLSGGGVLLVLTFPGGFAAAIADARERLVTALINRGTASPDDEAPDRGTRSVAKVGTVADFDTTSAPMSAATSLITPNENGQDGPILELVGLRKSFGGVEAVREVDLTIGAGEIVTLVGPNGAGKSTTFDLATGFVRPDGGTVRFNGREIGGLSPEQRVKLGLVRTFQDAALFPTLTVSEVLSIAASAHKPASFWSAMFGRVRGANDERRRVADTIQNFGLDKFREKRIADLSTGTRRIVELGCAVLLGARMLLLDEPSSGIAQREVEALGSLLRSLRDRHGLTLLVIEHDIALCRAISDRMVVMADGAVLCTGTCDDVGSDPLVLKAYFGEGEVALARSGPTRPAGRPGETSTMEIVP